MATFKVGQRVRIIVQASEFFGREATIVEVGQNKRVFGLGNGERHPLVYILDIDGYGVYDHETGRRMGYLPGDLAPLTDPKADEFIERIKKLKPYDEPRVEPQREHIGSPDWP